MEIAHIIADLRAKNKLSQRDLAKAIDVSPGVIGSWETGRILPGFESCIALADYFQISTDVLFEKDRSLSKEYYAPIDLSLDNQKQKILDVFSNLNEDNQDIILGKAKEILKEQRLEEKNQILENVAKRA